MERSPRAEFPAIASLAAAPSSAWLQFASAPTAGREGKMVRLYNADALTNFSFNLGMIAQGSSSFPAFALTFSDRALALL
jgi:hypothetical protein